MDNQRSPKLIVNFIYEEFHHSDDDTIVIETAPSPTKSLPQNLAVIERLKLRETLRQSSPLVVQTSSGIHQYYSSLSILCTKLKRKYEKPETEKRHSKLEPQFS